MLHRFVISSSKILKSMFSFLLNKITWFQQTAFIALDFFEDISKYHISRSVFRNCSHICRNNRVIHYQCGIARFHRGKKITFTTAFLIRCKLISYLQLQPIIKRILSPSFSKEVCQELWGAEWTKNLTKLHDWLISYNLEKNKRYIYLCVT